MKAIKDHNFAGRSGFMPFEEPLHKRFFDQYEGWEEIVLVVRQQTTEALIENSIKEL